jgi:putative Mg2+ transporter-C (MgtC) family protein
MYLDWTEVLLRLGAATAAGMALGLNRDLQNKPIGMRTLGLVALGAAIVVVATIYFETLVAHPDALSRVVQGVIQGITVWVTAALGIACGLAAWKIAAVGVGISLVLLAVVGWIEHILGLGESNRGG